MVEVKPYKIAMKSKMDFHGGFGDDNVSFHLVLSGIGATG